MTTLSDMKFYSPPMTNDFFTIDKNFQFSTKNLAQITFNILIKNTAMAQTEVTKVWRARRTTFINFHWKKLIGKIENGYFAIPSINIPYVNETALFTHDANWCVRSVP